MARPIKDLTGQRYGRLVAIRCVGIKNKNALWLCVCDCGNSTIVYANNLVKKTNATKSCGCLTKEAAAERRTAAHDNGRLYMVWATMKQRCKNPKTINYRYYGARGVSVCAQWDHSFELFREWAIANGYEDQAKRGICTIDRIDVNRGYEPDNCRIVDAKVQANNRRKRGVSQCKKLPLSAT